MEITLFTKKSRETKMKNLKTRLKEPSTYAGLAMFAGLLGLNIGTEILQTVGTAIIGIIGVVEIFRKEKK